MDWAIIKPHIFATIMDFFASGQPVISETNVGPVDTGKNDLFLQILFRNLQF